MTVARFADRFHDRAVDTSRPRVRSPRREPMLSRETMRPALRPAPLRTTPRARLISSQGTALDCRVGDDEMRRGAAVAVVPSGPPGPAWPLVGVTRERPTRRRSSPLVPSREFECPRSCRKPIGLPPAHVSNPPAFCVGSIVQCFLIGGQADLTVDPSLNLARQYLAPTVYRRLTGPDDRANWHRGRALDVYECEGIRSCSWSKRRAAGTARREDAVERLRERAVLSSG